MTLWSTSLKNMLFICFINFSRGDQDFDDVMYPLTSICPYKFNWFYDLCSFFENRGAIDSNPYPKQKYW